MFQNDEKTGTTLSYTVERPSTLGSMTIAIVDPSSGSLSGVQNPLQVRIVPHSREYRWLVLGEGNYVNRFGQGLKTGGFSLEKVSPNPFRGNVWIEYNLPYGGYESTRCEVIDQLGRLVWYYNSGRDVHPGRNRVVFNPSSGRRNLVVGVYMFRLTGFNGVGKTVG